MQERRRFVRVPEDSPISYEIISESKTEGFIIKDLSQGGLRFFIRKFIPNHSLLKIKITLKSASFYFESVVRVVWIKEEVPNERYEIGAEFINLPKKASESLIEYIKNAIKPDSTLLL
ncbi:MAG: PilZ domain-containing protein [Candidatus Omnitrophota bacterium]